MSAPDFQSDWENREFIQNVQYNIMQIAQFLNKFDMNVRGKLAGLNHRLTRLEREVEFLEVALTDFDKRADLRGARLGLGDEEETGAQ